MDFDSVIQQRLEEEEVETVGKSFGGASKAVRKSYSLTSVRDLVIAAAEDDQVPRTTASNLVSKLTELLPDKELKYAIGSICRFAFLIELTDLKIGSTKMKTRWMPGRILMPQKGSFAPIQGVFEPGNDPRAASYADCLDVFSGACHLLVEQLTTKPSLSKLVVALSQNRRVPYEFLFEYRDPSSDPVHSISNIKWCLNPDLLWLVTARSILRAFSKEAIGEGLRELEKKKLEVKVFKTDRALTGKDKTNRAKRWEVLYGDFQHATMTQCWSAERKLTEDLVRFQDFPAAIALEFTKSELLKAGNEPSCCPVTFEPLNFPKLIESILEPQHGVSQYQIGHLHPLKRGGTHDGGNVCWQSANGNRIQGDLSIEDTMTMLDGIAEKRGYSK